MTAPIRRRYLPDEVEAQLLAALRRGDYGDRLPGERTLAEAFRVSRPTLRRAIAALTTQGWLRRSHGRATLVVTQPEVTGAPRDKTACVAFLSSHPLRGLSAGTMLTYDLLSESLATAGLTLQYAECAAFRSRSTDHSLREAVRKMPADAYILHQASPAVQRWFSENKPLALVMGTPAPGVTLPGLDTDFSPAAEHAMGELRRQGHDPARVLLLLPKLSLAGHDAMREGFLKAGGLPASVIHHPVDDEAFGPWIAREIVSRLNARSGPTAVITGWARFTVALLSALGARHQMKIPDTLSLVCLADDPVFDMVIPRVSRYRRPAEKFVRRLSRMAEEVAQNLPPSEGPTRLMPEFVPGGSIARPRA